MGNNQKYLDRVKSDPELYKEFVEERRWNAKKSAFVKRRVSHSHVFPKQGLPKESIKLYKEINK